MADLQKTGVVLVAEGVAAFERAMAGAKGEVANFGRESRDATKETRVLGLSMTDLKSVFQMAGRVVRAVGDAYQATVGELITYATEVRELSSITGQSSEETSRLIQVFGDFEIGTGQITAAMRAMRTEGLSPTIDTLASLSDQYLSLAPGVQRADFLFRTFGRAGADLAPLMDQGSAAIRRRAAAVQDGLVLSQQEIDDADTLRQATDDLNDSKQALANTIALRSIPTILQLTDATNDLLVEDRNLVDWSGEVINALFGLGQSMPVQPTRDEAFAIRDLYEALGESELPGARAAIQGFSRDEVQAAIDTRNHRVEIENLNRILDDLEGRHIRATVDIVANWDAALNFLMGEHAATGINYGVYNPPTGETVAGVWTSENANYQARKRYWESVHPGQTYTGAASGADWMVGGRGGTDRNLIQFAATRGERIIVMPPRANPAGPSYSSADDNSRHVSIGQMGMDATNPFAMKRLFDQWLQGG